MRGILEVCGRDFKIESVSQIEFQKRVFFIYNQSWKSINRNGRKHAAVNRHSRVSTIGYRDIDRLQVLPDPVLEA